MDRKILQAVIVGTAIITCSRVAAAQSGVAEKAMTKSTIEIPKSLQVEHHAIHEGLEEATKAPGRVGVAAKALAAVVHPHFMREEQIALPPLGLLAPLSAGTQISPATLTEALAMSDSLRAELPRMLEEHKGIRAAVGELRTAAKAENSAKYVELSDQLALHAQSEEEVMYPAAVLVGDIIRARQQKK